MQTSTWLFSYFFNELSEKRHFYHLSKAFLYGVAVSSMGDRNISYTPMADIPTSLGRYSDE